MDQELLSLVMKAWAAWSENPGSPFAFGVVVLLLVHLVTKVPRVSTAFNALAVRIEQRFPRITLDVSRRAMSIFVSTAPGLALILTEHMTWGVGLRTAFLSWAVSQAIFFLSKEKSKLDAKATAPLVLLVLAAFSVSQTACTPEQARKVESALEASRDIANEALPCFASAQKVALAACNGDEKCVDAVYAKSDRIADLYDLAHDGWCALWPESEGCK